MDGRLVLWFLAVDVLLVLTPGADWLYVIARSLGRWRLGLVAVAGICTAYVGYTLLAATGVAAALRAVPGVLPGLKYAGAAYLAFLAVTMLRTAHRQRPDTGADPAPASHELTSDNSAATSKPTSTEPPASGHPTTGSAATSKPTSTEPAGNGDPPIGGVVAGGGSRGSQPSNRAVFLQSFLTGLLNPKALLLFLALLPQFAEPSAGLPIGFQLAVLGLLHVVCCAVGYCVVAVSASKLAGRIARSATASRVLPVVSAAILLVVAGVSLL